MAEIVTETPADKALLSPAEQQINLPTALAPAATAPVVPAAVEQAEPALDTVEVPVLRATPANQPNNDAEEWLAVHQEKLRARIAREGATAADLGAVGVDPRNVLDDNAFDMVRPHLQKATAAFADVTKPHAELAVGLASGAIQDEVGRMVGTAAQKVAQGYLDLSAELADVLSDNWMRVGRLGSVLTEDQKRALHGDLYLTWDDNNDLGISFGEKPDDYRSMTLPKWFSDPTTDAGKVGAGILQFAGNMALLNAGRMGTIPSQWAKWTAIGTAADGLFDPKDGGFATMLLDLGVEPNAVLEFLDPDVTEDSTSEERLIGRGKLMLEGAGIGFGIDIAMNAPKLFYRGLRALKNLPEMREKAIAHLQAWQAARGIQGGEVADQLDPPVAPEALVPIEALPRDEEAARLAALAAGERYDPAQRLQTMIEGLMADHVPQYENMGDFLDDTLRLSEQADTLEMRQAADSTAQLFRDKISEALNYNFDPDEAFTLEQIITGVRRAANTNTDPTGEIAQMARMAARAAQPVAPAPPPAAAETEIIPSAPREDPDLDELGFYSAALRASQSMPQQTGTPDQMRKALLKQLDVKAEELGWTGLDDLFATAKKEKRQVTAKEIEQHLARNRVEIEVDETVKVEPVDESGYDQDTMPNWPTEDGEHFGSHTALTIEEGYGVEYLADRTSEIIVDIRGDLDMLEPGGWMHNEAKSVLGDDFALVEDMFGNDVLPQWVTQDHLENIADLIARKEYVDNPVHRITDDVHGYEIVGQSDIGWTVKGPGGQFLTEYAPRGQVDASGRRLRQTRHFDNESEAMHAVEDDAFEMGLVEHKDDYQPEYAGWTHPGGTNYREFLFKFDTPHGEFTGGHFSDGEYVDPGVPPGLADDYRTSETHPNVFAHARVKDREVVMPDGTNLKMLGLEEAQTDWHKAKRERGGGPYKPPKYNRMPERPASEAAEEYDAQQSVIRPILRARLSDPAHGLNEGEAGLVHDLLRTGEGFVDADTPISRPISPWAGQDHSDWVRSGLDSRPPVGSLDDTLAWAKSQLADLRAYADSLSIKLDDGTRAFGGPEIELSNADKRRMAQLEKDVAQLWIWKNIPDDVLARRNALAHEWQDTNRWESSQGQYSGYGRDGVPDAPFKQMSEQGWPKVVTRRMVRHAIENGYDGIMWTTGKTQHDRYNAPTALYDKTIPKIIKSQIIKKHDKAAVIEAVPHQRTELGHEDNYDNEAFKMLRFTDKMRESVRRFGNALFAAPPIAVGAGAAIEQQQQQQQQ